VEKSFAYKVELKPNNAQRTLLKKHAGVARFAWNWGLENRIKLYEASKQTTDAMKQHKELNALKPDQFPWMYEVSKCAPQEALRDLDRCFRNFFEKRAGFPKFKKKGKKENFRLTGSIKLIQSQQSQQSQQSNQFKNQAKNQGKNSKNGKKDKKGKKGWIQLPRLKKIRVKEFPSLDLEKCKILSATVSCQADRWFVSLTTTEDIADPIAGNKSSVVVVDLGLSKLAVVSNGGEFISPKPLKRQLRKLKKLSKQLSRKLAKSKNWYKTLKKLKKLHFQISCQRGDILHKLSSQVLSQADFIVLEDLAVKNMVKNRKLARSISDMGWGELRRQFEYKGVWSGKEIIIAPRFFPSSKLCFHCEFVKDKLSLDDRIFECERCSYKEDRDMNASKNLEKYGRLSLISPTVAASWVETLNVCGAGVRQKNGLVAGNLLPGYDCKFAASMKQKVSSNV
jgi:putative transposase